MNIKRNIIFSLEKRKKNSISIIDNVPIRMRIVYGGQRLELTTGYRIDVVKWDEDKQRVKNGCTNKLKQSASDINSDLNKYFSEIQAIFKEYEVRKIVPTLEQIKNDFKAKYNTENNNNNKSEKLVDIFNIFIKESSIRNNWEKSTTKRVSNAGVHLKNYDKDLTFNNLSTDVFFGYVEYLDRVGLRNSTINKQVNILKWFLRWSVNNGYYADTSFESFKPKLKMTAKKVIFLEWDELIQIRELEIPDTKKYLDRVRDVFLFQCYTGLRYSDVYNLKRSDIKEDHIEITTVKMYIIIEKGANFYVKSIPLRKDFKGTKNA